MGSSGRSGGGPGPRPELRRDRDDVVAVEQGLVPSSAWRMGWGVGASELGHRIGLVAVEGSSFASGGQRRRRRETVWLGLDVVGAELILSQGCALV